jgi:hypothetical protein
MMCMFLAKVHAREVLADKSLGRPLIVEGCPNQATHEVWQMGRFLGAYCSAPGHDHSSRAIIQKPRTGRIDPDRLWLYDADTGRRLQPVSVEMRAARKPGEVFVVIEGGVKLQRVLRPYRSEGAPR